VTDRSSVPLCIDLDGTLIRSDTLVESLIDLLRREPWTVLALPGWLAAGKVNLKSRVAERTAIAVDSLPYRDDLVTWAREESAHRPVFLVTAAHRSIAEAVARHLGFFTEVLATESANLKGERKAEALVARFGVKGFDYAGNDVADLAVWRRAREAVVVGAPPAVAAAARSTSVVGREFDPAQSPLRQLGLWIRALRLYQWVKNLLVFVAPAAAHTLLQTPTLIASVLAFLSFGLVASGVYLLNDLLDLRADRLHPRKRGRPFASGQLSLAAGLASAPLLIAAGLALAIAIGWTFAAVLLVYLVCTTTYSVWLKRHAFIDVALLAALYTLRVVAGAAAVGLTLSFWLLAVCAYGFLGLALLKRFAELREMEADGRVDAAGRGYSTNDVPVVLALGVGASLLATLVTALYIESYASRALYARPEALWALVGLMLLGVGRLWMKAGRGQMHDDPIVFVARDLPSVALAACAAAAVAFAI
jgi:4-hydroxybenzoate polyprenyltransferase/phosphoserine phosphatase